jgi:heptaprenyl diphosphate synthase
MKSKKYAYLGLMIALAFVFSYIEFLLPINLGIPGVKLGLANLVVIVAIYTIGTRDAFLLSVIRIVLVAFTFGNMSAMLYSLAGGMLSFLVMAAAKRLGWFSTKGVSVLGGIFHNVGQILMAMAILQTAQLIYYLPVLMISGIVTGFLIGLLAALIITRIKGAQL